MKATIWHNPNCSKSRQALETLQSRDGVELTVVKYIQDPPTKEKLAQLYRDAGMSPAEGLRFSGTDAAARSLPEESDDAILSAMVAEPKLIERPLVETEKGVRLCRPPERIDEIL